MQQVEFARHLRQRQTDAEAKLWRHLRNRELGVKFRRQVPIAGYFADFLSNEVKLIVEIDGIQHRDERYEHDRIRTRALEQAGYEVMRYWNREVMTNTDEVVRGIGMMIEHLQRPSPDIEDVDLSQRER